MSKESVGKNRIIAAIMSGIVAISAIAGSLYFNSAKAYAKVTLRGIESIAEAHSVSSNDETPTPFIILEVVPTLDDARFGYIVGGEEPVKDGKSIKDMPSKAERERWMVNDASATIAVEGYDYDPSYSFDPMASTDTIIASLRDAGAFSWSSYTESNLTEAAKMIALRGYFKDVVSPAQGYYDSNDHSADYEIAYQYAGFPDISTLYDNNLDAEGNVIRVYRKTYAYRTEGDDYKGNYYFDIVRIDDPASEMPADTDDAGVYNFQYFKADAVLDTDNLEEGQLIYKSNNGVDLEYVGVVKRMETPAGDSVLFILMNDGEHILEFWRLEDNTYPIPDLTDARIDDPSDDAYYLPKVSDLAALGASFFSMNDNADGTPTPTATADGTPTPTAEPTAAADGTPTPTVEPTATADATPSATADPTSDPTVEPTAAPTADPMVGKSGVPSVTPVNVSIKARTSEYGVLGATRSDETFYVVREDNGNGSDTLYRINKNTITSGKGPFGRREEFVPVNGNVYNSSNASSSKGPYYIKKGDSDDYLYKPAKDGGYDFRADYTKDVYQSFKYEGGFKNAEWFKKYVLDREDNQCDNLYVDVIPVTMDMLDDYVGSANLIYFAGGRYESDISKKSAMAIHNKVLDSTLSVIFERSTYFENLKNSDSDPAKAKERTNLTLLYLEQTQSEKKSVSDSDWDTIIADFAAHDDPLYANKTLSEVPDSEKSNVSEKRSTLLSGMYSPHDAVTKYEDLGGGVKKPVTKKDISFVHGTVFVNDNYDDCFDNGDGTYGKVLVDAKVLSGDFNTQYTDTKINSINGFSEIQSEYDSEKPIIETYSSWDNFNHSISKATCIRYILNANNDRNAVKTALRILDLEPLASDQFDEEELRSGYKNAYGEWGNTYSNVRLTRDILTKSWVKTNLEYTGADSALDIVQIGTREFIGMNEDLNETYDMIYIGMDTALMNTEFSGDLKTNKTVYTDSTLNGLVYMHMGDLIGYEYGGSRDLKLAGNDITRDKLRELTDYVKAGYAVLLSDDFFVVDKDGKIESINTKKVDQSSYMYKFVNEVVMAKKDDGSYKYLGKNVFRKGQMESTYAGFTAARQVFLAHLNISKLDIELLEKPQPYNENGKPNYLVANSDGSYTLKYRVKLKNDSVVDASNTSYDCKLYIDFDSDGKFEDGEALTGLDISDGGYSDGKYHLKAGNEYTITRLAPEDYIGFMSWKLVFIQNEKESDESDSDTRSIKSAVSGFCAIPADGQRPPVDVLQITPEWGNSLDLTSTEMQKLYDEVTDFEVRVHKITVAEYVKKSDLANHANEKSYYDYLCQYDMVVIGFIDNFDFTGGGGDTYEVWEPTVNADGTVTTKQVNKSKDEAITSAILGIREYALSGRSILFTHDLTSLSDNRPGDKGYHANIYLRDIMGMDRYNHLALSNLENENHKLKEYMSEYDYMRQNGKDIDESVGFTDANLERWGWGKREYFVTNRALGNAISTGKAEDRDGSKKETITALNEGQITQYPFLITEGTHYDPRASFEASFTHAQYYQLNLDTDSTDSYTDDDVVVWYTISNRDKSLPPNYVDDHYYYRNVFGDARNNYYIYSKGNVMYTGAGHSAVTSSYEMERKLFVNTLVAAYNHGVHAPKVAYKENPWEGSIDIQYLYLPYDAYMIKDVVNDTNVGDWLDQTVVINFKTVNNNFKDSQKPLQVKYYIKVSSASEATLTVGTDYYKEINPIDLKLVVEGTKTSVSDFYNLKNYQIYQATFRIADFGLNNGSELLPMLPDDFGEFYIQIGTDELSTGSVESLQAYESLMTNKLKFYTMRLFELE